ncbi:MAG: hypothetical protein V7K38_03820 [Nostoc sp.]|uniref:hypothetical protein n=1 Tax=Nostoc sp. TaxID=1180 RepID=UPI002FF50491
MFGVGGKAELESDKGKSGDRAMITTQQLLNDLPLKSIWLMMMALIPAMNWLMEN